MKRGKSRKQPKPPRSAGTRARTTHEAAGDPTSGNNRSAGNEQSTEGQVQHKIKRSRPLLLASCVLLIAWFSILFALAWHSAN